MNLTEQGYYNLVIYESDPEDFKHLFEQTEDGELLDHIEDLETALDFISDRMTDGLLEREVLKNMDTDMQTLYLKALELETLRRQALEEDYSPHIDLNVILH